MHPSRTLLLLGRLGLLALASLLGCATYRSEVVSSETLAEKVLSESPRAEVPGTRRASLRARLELDGERERLVLEEVVVADFATDRRVIARRAEVRRATVRSEMLSVNDGYHANWFFPHSTAYIESNDDVALGVVSYIFALPLVTWSDLVVDVVSLPYHTLQMILNERDRVVESEPRSRLDFERDVVLEVSPLAGEVQAVRVHRGDETTLIPELDARGEFVLSASELLPLDAPLDDRRAELEVSFLHGGVARRLPVELPPAWQALRRAERGFDGEGLFGGGAPHPRVSLHLPDTLRAGDAAFLALDVANTGTGDFLDLVAELRSPHPHLNGRQLPLGRLRPGESTGALVRLAVPRNDPGGVQRVGVVFRSGGAQVVDPLLRELEILPRAAPRLVASLEPVIVLPPVDPMVEAVNAMAEAATVAARDASTRGTAPRTGEANPRAVDATRTDHADDTRPHAAATLNAPRLAPLRTPPRPELLPGNTLTFRAHVRNVGAGDALGTRLELDAPHPALQVPTHALSLGDLLPGQSASVEFEVTLSEHLRVAELPLLVSVIEDGLGERSWQDLSLPLGREVPALPGALDPPVLLSVRQTGLLARMAGLPADTQLPAFEVLGERWHVQLPDGRAGWVDDETVRLAPEFLSAQRDAVFAEMPAASPDDTLDWLDTPTDRTPADPFPALDLAPAESARDEAEPAEARGPPLLLRGGAEAAVDASAAASSRRDAPRASSPPTPGLPTSDAARRDTPAQGAAAVSARLSSSAPGSSPAKSSPAKSSPAKSSPAKSSATKSSASHSSAAKSSATKPAAAKPSPAKSTPAQSTHTEPEADPAALPLTPSTLLSGRPVPNSPRPPPPDVGEQLVFAGTPGKMPDDRPPLIRLDRPLPRRVDLEHLRVALRAHDDHELRELRVKLNGRDLRTELADTRDEQQRLTAQRAVARLALRPGLNRVELVASDGVNDDTIVEHVIFRESELAQRWLVVIGVDDYADDALPDLHAAQSDALALGDALGASLRVAPERRLALLGREATRRALFTLLDDELAAELDAGDELVIVFAGHAAAWDANGTPTLALVPQDAGAALDPDALWTLDELALRFDALPTDQITLLVDAGFAAGEGRGLGVGLAPALHEAALAPLLGRRGRLLLAAADLSRAAPELERHGSLSDALLELLDGAGDLDSDGRLTLRELRTPLEEALTERGVAARPVLFGDTRDDLLLNRDRER